MYVYIYIHIYIYVYIQIQSTNTNTNTNSIQYNTTQHITIQMQMDPHIYIYIRVYVYIYMYIYIYIFLWGRRHPEIPGDSGDLLWKLVFRAFWEPRLSKRLDMESEPALEPKCLQYIHVILHQVILSYCEAIVWGCLHPPCTEPHDWRIEPLHR